MAGTPPPPAGYIPRLVTRPAEVEDKCRCGIHLRLGARCLEIVDVPRELADWIQGRSFCGPACARAYLLEAIEPLEAAEGGQNMIVALRAVVASLEASFVGPPPSPPLRRRSE